MTMKIENKFNIGESVTVEHNDGSESEGEVLSISFSTNSYLVDDDQLQYLVWFSSGEMYWAHGTERAKN